MQCNIDNTRYSQSIVCWAELSYIRTSYGIACVLTERAALIRVTYDSEVLLTTRIDIDCWSEKKMKSFYRQRHWLPRLSSRWKYSAVSNQSSNQMIGSILTTNIVMVSRQRTITLAQNITINVCWLKDGRTAAVGSRANKTWCRCSICQSCSH